MRKYISRIIAVILVVSFIIAIPFNMRSVSAAPVANASVVNVSSVLNVRSRPSTKGSLVTTLTLGTRVTYIEQVNHDSDDTSSSDKWVKISVVKNGVTYDGYVASLYVMKDLETGNPSEDEAFETSIAGFPESYKPYLRNLHTLHPNWVFYPDNTGLSWITCLDKETKPGVSLVQNTTDASWQSQVYKGVVDSPNWVNASKGLVSYYLDPRNMLTESSVFQFVDLRYVDDSISVDAIDKILSGTFMAYPKAAKYDSDEYKYYREIFAIASNNAAEGNKGVNPVFLAAHAIQECGINGSVSSSGATGYYNFYNIGAYSDVIDAAASGLTLAKVGLDAEWNKTYQIPWNTAGLSIVNGAKWIYDNYTNKGQYTLYYMRFNLSSNKYYSAGTHQYMTATQSVAAEGQRMYEAYKSAGILDTTISFYIPVYTDMPTTPCPIPKRVNPGVWKRIEGKWYLVDDAGNNKTGWQLVNDSWYYMDSDGVMKTGWLKKDGHWYYFNSLGCAATGWSQIGGVWYYFNSSCAMVTGWKLIDGNWYYFSSSGAMVKGWQLINGIWYYFSPSGTMLTGWQRISNEWYYFSPSGTMLIGWQFVNSKWYYLQYSGTMTTGWQQIDGNMYYFDSLGAMTTGWKQIDDTRYYFTPSGTVAKGWQLIDSAWYYFDNSGSVVTGWLEYKDDKYYLDSNGKMTLGWVLDDSEWYYLDSTGRMQTGWVWYYGKWYYCDPAMVRDTWVENYYLDENGVLDYQVSSTP